MSWHTQERDRLESSDQERHLEDIAYDREEKVGYDSDVEVKDSIVSKPHGIDYSSRDVINTIKKTVAVGASDAQLAQFLEVCKSTGLNPFLKEIWCIPKTNTIMASRDGYLRVANDHPMFDGMESDTIDDEKGVPIKGYCIVYRKDRSHPVKMTAKFLEYNKPGQQVWRQYPSAMIIKVAEVLALKRSFTINGVVTAEEMGVETLSQFDTLKSHRPPKELTPPITQAQEMEKAVKDIETIFPEARVISEKKPKPKAGDILVEDATIADVKKKVSFIQIEKGIATLRNLIMEKEDKENVSDSRDDLAQLAFEDEKMTFDGIMDIKSLPVLRAAYRNLKGKS